MGAPGHPPPPCWQFVCHGGAQAWRRRSLDEGTVGARFMLTRSAEAFAMMCLLRAFDC